MLNSKKAQKGQALVLITLAIVGMLGLSALAIDGSNAFLQRRDAQSAADAAVMAGALAKLNSQNISSTALSRAASNGFDNNGTTNTVVINSPPLNDCNGASSPYTGNTEYVQVLITTTTSTYFASLVGINQTSSCVEAIARAKASSTGAPFFGNAVVGLNPTGYSFDAWGNSTWYISGGGVFANNNAQKKSNKDSVNFDSGDCVTAVGTASGWSDCTVDNGRTDLAFTYPDDIYALLPRIPACNGTAYRGGDGKLYPEAGKDGSVVDHFEDNYAAGLFCITDADGNFHGTTTGTNVTFYISDQDYTMRFNGGGGLAVSAPTSGEYAGVLMFSGITTTPCTQNFEYRGNGTGVNIGTVFMPSACIDVRGNGNSSQTDSQIIGYTVSSNGTGDVYVSYNDANNYQITDPPTIEMTR